MEKNTITMKTPLRLSILALSLLLLFSCQTEKSGDPASASGKGGSMARFTIYNNYLYTVDQQKLNVFNLTNAEKPVFVKDLQSGFDIETIFVNNNTLFLGSQWGMYIFDISEPTNPVNLSFFQHIYSCDPVVANDTLAYLTMRTETFCGRNTNELQVIDIRNRAKPQLVSSITMTKPFGLGLDGDKLFVCDNGLKLFSLTDPLHPVLVNTFSIPAIDVIPDNNLLMVLATDGLYQYQYENNTVTLISHLQ